MGKRARVPEGRVIFSVDHGGATAPQAGGKGLFFSGGSSAQDGRGDVEPEGMAAGADATVSTSEGEGTQGQERSQHKLTAPTVGKRFGSYFLISELGRGPSGVVYRARRLDSGFEVALKVIHPWLSQLPGFIDRMVAALRTTAELRHMNITPIHEVGEADGHYYVVAELRQCRTVRQLLASDGVPDHERSVQIAIQAAVAIDYAHSRGVSHGGIKSNNVLIGMDDRTTIADFALASLADEAMRAASAGVVVGNADYSAPEQLFGRPASPAADRYSFAAVFYELLSGQPPFRDAGPMGVIAGHLGKPPPAISSVRPSLPASLDTVFVRALSKDPDERYPTCGLLVQAAAGEMRSPVVIPVPTRSATIAPMAKPVLPPPAKVAVSNAGLGSQPPSVEIGRAAAVIVTVVALIAGLALGLSRLDVGGTLAAVFPIAQQPATATAEPTPEMPALAEQTPASTVAAQTPVPAPVLPTVVPVPTWTPVPPTPSPGGTAPVVVPSVPTGTLVVVRPVGGSANGLYTLSPNGGDLAPIAGLPAGWNWAPAASPDGQWLVFSTGDPNKGKVGVSRRDGSEFRIAAEGGPHALSSPWWHPDGRIAFTATLAERSDIFAASLEGGEAVQLTHTSGTVSETRIPSWPSAGGDLIFSGRVGSLARIFLQDAGDRPRPVSPDRADATTPAWSPDGRRVAFAGVLSDGRTGIFTMAPDGTQVTQVARGTRTSWACCAAWSPDSQWLTFIGDLGTGLSPNHGNLYVVPAGGGEARKILGDGATYYWRPTWLP